MKIVVSEKQLNLLVTNSSEIGEQEDGTETGTSDAGAGTTAGSKKWESGVTRGPSNQIGVTKWSETVGSKITRGKANPIW
jgi:hypothetical protein